MERIKIYIPLFERLDSLSKTIKSMNYSKEIIKRAHKHSIFNKAEILKSETCVCFFCQKLQNLMKFQNG